MSQGPPAKNCNFLNDLVETKIILKMVVQIHIIRLIISLHLALHCPIVPFNSVCFASVCLLHQLPVRWFIIEWPRVDKWSPILRNNQIFQGVPVYQTLRVVFTLGLFTRKRAHLDSNLTNDRLMDPNKIEFRSVSFITGLRLYSVHAVITSTTSWCHTRRTLLPDYYKNSCNILQEFTTINYNF